MLFTFNVSAALTNGKTKAAKYEDLQNRNDIVFIQIETVNLAAFRLTVSFHLRQGGPAEAVSVTPVN